jgi:hypothetical protein
MAVLFLIGGGAMTVLSSVVGPYAEAAALGLVGMGLVGSSQWVSARPKLVGKPSEAQ